MIGISGVLPTAGASVSAENATMARFLATRLASMIGVLVLVTSVTWLIIHTSRQELFAGDPRPVAQQLAGYLRDAFLRLDLGNSLEGSRDPVTDILREGIVPDLSLLVGSLAFGLGAGIAAGIYCAARPGTLAARALEWLAMVFFCAPVYVVGLTVLLLFGSQIAYLVGFVPLKYVHLTDDPLGWLGSLIVPWIVLGLPVAAVCLRMMRASLSEVLHEEYMLTALGKGLSREQALRRHGARAAIGPVFSVAGVTIPPLLVTNLVLVEHVFSIPGVFQDLARSMESGDFPVLQGQVLFAAVLVGATTLIVDVALAWADPRVR
jgi:peptide/nickel transport system permease protein